MDVAQVSIELLGFLFVIAIVAGCLDTLAGGGGLIAVPALIVGGLPPLAALATNKLQGSMGTATATFMMLKNDKIRWAESRPLMAMAFVGAALGTVTVQFVDAKVLSFVVPIVLLVTAVYFLVAPTPGEQERSPVLSNEKYKSMVVPAIGFYDGMFGPGTGSFFALAGVACRGQSLMRSTAVAKSLNFATNIASLIVFVLAGQVVWMVGLLMMAGQLIGAALGSHFLFRIKPTYLRVIVVVMCLGMLARYSYSMGGSVAHSQDAGRATGRTFPPV